MQTALARVKNSCICIVILAGMLTGCGDAKQPESVNDSMAAITTEEVIEKEPEIPETSIAYKDWKIKESPVDGLDNLYELDIERFVVGDSFIATVNAIHSRILLITTESEKDSTVLLIDPLSTDIVARAAIPDGVYYSDSVKTDEAGNISISNIEKGQMYVFDENLQNMQTIDIPAAEGNFSVASGDFTHIYYYDTENSKFISYDVNANTKDEIFSDVDVPEYAFPDLLSLMADGKCLLFSYFSEAEEKTVYEIRDISTGESKYKSEHGISNVKYSDGDYILQYESDNLADVIYKKKDEAPVVLSLENYREYESVETNMTEKKVVTADSTARLNGDGNTVSWKCYDINEGSCPYKLSLEIKEGENEGSYSKGYYLDGADAVFCQTSGEKNRYYIWDLTKESSKSGDEKNYIYKWQDPDNPDKDELARLRVLADEIGKENGVEIYFGDDVKNCPNDVYDYTVTNNVIRIEKMLDILKMTLSKYPKGMLAQLDDDYGSVLHIYLSGKIYPIDEVGIETAIGIQKTIEDNTFLVLDINSFGDLENTIYHEIFHAVEIHLNQTENGYFDDMEWEALNPPDFTYDYDYHANEENFNFDYSSGDTEHEAYFVDTYAKSFPNEDRARIMEYAMIEDKYKQEQIKAEHIQAKLKYISERMRKGFDTTGWPEKTTWEKALLP